MIRKLISHAAALAAMSFASLAIAGDRDPVGEKADYTVDRDPARTSSMILGGEIKASVTRFLPNDPTGPAYETKLDYSFRIQWIGTRQGTEIVNTPDEYFTEEFLQSLRTDGIYVGPKFKIKHLGYGDASTLDGHSYPHCDKLLIYDIQTTAAPFAKIAAAAFGATRADEIEDMEIVAHVFYGVPVLGAVKLDMSGKYNGMNIKVGGDYQAPTVD